jgi:hypothetical protein
MVRSIYASRSIAEEDRDTVFMNMLSIIPHYGMNDSSDNANIISNSRAVFRAVGGDTKNDLFSQDEVAAYQTAACITNHIFRTPEESPHDLTGIGFSPAEGGFTIDDDGLELLKQNVDRIDSLREKLMERRTLNPDVIRELVAGGVLGDGTL